MPPASAFWSAREVANGVVDGTDAQYVLVPFQNRRLAVITWPASRPDRAQVGVLDVSTSGAYTNADGFKALVSGEREESEESEEVAQEKLSELAAWCGVWSPDGRLLVICGHTLRDDAVDTAVWVYTQSRWMDGEQIHETTSSSPLLLRVDPSESLRKDAQWRKTKGKNGVCATIETAFFHNEAASRCFLLARDGWFVSMEVQTAELLLLARSHSGSEDVPAKAIAKLIQFKSVTSVTNWHAGITAATFHRESATLVITGGIKNPSEELRSQCASSLTVWKVTPADPFFELLDFTMVLGGPLPFDNADSSADGEVGEDGSLKDAESVKKAGKSFFGPLKFIVGEDETVLPGRVRHVDVSSDGLYLSLVDGRGRYMIRQIDVCANVTAWEYYASTSEGSVDEHVTQVLWLSPKVLAFVTSQRHVMYGHLKVVDESPDVLEGEEEEEENSPLSSVTVLIDTLEVQRDNVTISADKGQITSAISTVFLKTADDMIEELKANTSFRVFELTVPVTKSNEWVITESTSVSIGVFMCKLVSTKQFERALAFSATYSHQDDWEPIDLDDIHRQVWLQYRKQMEVDNTNGVAILRSDEDAAEAFEKALAHLNAVESDTEWIINECLHVVTETSLLETKEIVATGLRAVMNKREASGEGSQLFQEAQTQLSRFIYRLDTLKEIIVAEMDEDERLAYADEQCYDGVVYLNFREASIVDTATQFAQEGRIEALSVLFYRHGYNLLPHRQRIVESLPVSASPLAYAHFLPAIGPLSEEGAQRFHTLLSSQTPEGGIMEVVEVPLLPENHSHDLTPEELVVFESSISQSPLQRRDEYALWFTHRMVEMDSLYGQLHNAFLLGQCAAIGLRLHQDGAAIVESTPFEEFLLHSERLFKCAHVLQLSSCCLVSLEDWSLLSLHDQVMTVMEDFSDPELSLYRLRVAFLEQRRHAYALDEVMSWLTQVVMAKHRSLLSLVFCAQVIHESNPSNPDYTRWIQNDARLLRTALDIVFASKTADLLSQDEAEKTQSHQVFVEQLWRIFQSLPERKDDDPPELAQLQVEIDGMEDLLLAMDTVAKYGVVISPAEVRDRVQAEDPATESIYAGELVEVMCRVGLTASTSTETMAQGEEEPMPTWMLVWRDAMKLKTHVFGERVSQETILGILLRHLLRDTEHHGAARELITKWIAIRTDAISLIMDILLDAVRHAVDDGSEASEEAKQAVVGIAQEMLLLPVLDSSPELEQLKANYEEVLTKEASQTIAHTLLELLSYGAVKISVEKLRMLQTNEERLDVIMQIYSSNPSHYKMSPKARRWLETTVQRTVNDEVLDGVLFLAELLQVSHERPKIMMKAAYAALYSLDYDVAHRLVTQIVVEFRPETVSTEDQTQDSLTLLLSLVLDIISASSFHSWEKKIQLGRSVFACDGVLTHSMFDLLLERLQKLEAVSALAGELGLSERDVEDRREQDDGSKCSVEEALLKELEIVMELLHEEKQDRRFLLRLLQKGFQVVQQLSAQSRMPPTSPTSRRRPSSSDLLEQEQWIERASRHMVSLAFEEAHRLLLGSEQDQTDNSDWVELMEYGFGYLLYVGKPQVISSVWHEDIRPMCSTGSSASDTEQTQKLERFVERFRQFFFFLAASDAHSNSTTSEQDTRTRVSNLMSLQSSFSTAQSIVHKHQHEPESDFDDEADGSSKRSASEVFETYSKLARECQDMMHSHKKSQEVEAISTFFNVELDLERFASDEAYRFDMVQQMSTKKEHFHIATQFAAKYGMDEYQCLLAYIRHAFLPWGTTVSALPPAVRQEQLEQAFRSDQHDFLEQALQHPVAFGEFLLHPENGVYDSLPGTDHIGILLVLRMVLECSKRAAQIPPSTAPLFPLSDASSHRVTLLFMCLKRLKEISITNEYPDFKAVCGARTVGELLHPPTNLVDARAVAIHSITPFLNGKTIKMATKILQKVHHLSASTLVLIYLDELLGRIWEEQAEKTTSYADLAVYAYESCVPFLSVLSNDHFQLFHQRFIARTPAAASPESIALLREELYGHQVRGLDVFGQFLSTEKRMELMSDHLGLFQTRVSSLKTTNPADEDIARREEELGAMEEELLEAVFWHLVDMIRSNAFFTTSMTDSWLAQWINMMQEWFHVPSALKVQQEDRVLNGFVNLCERVTSLEMATLLVEVALSLTTPREVVARAVEDIYRKGVSDVIQQALAEHGEEMGDVVAEWASDVVPTKTRAPHPCVDQLASYLSELNQQKASQFSSQEAETKRVVFHRVVSQLERFSSPTLRELLQARREKPTAGDDSTVQGIVVSQWKEVIAQYEQQENWITSAVLSHVLWEQNVSSISSDSRSDREWYFGLRVKAISTWLSHHEHADAWTSILSTPSEQLYTSFQSSTFEQLLKMVEEHEQASRVRVASQLTGAIAVMVRHYEEIQQGPHASDSHAAWKKAREDASLRRMQEGFQVTVGSTEDPHDEQLGEPSTMWPVLLERGVWDDRLLGWYTSVAYDKINDLQSISAFVQRRGDANPALAILLLLACPFHELRQQHEVQILAGSRHLLTTGGISAHSKHLLLELLLLRIDLGVLLQQIEGLDSHLLAFYDVLSPGCQSSRRTELKTWTSTVEYFVCRLTLLQEYALASRVVCALWRVHTMLWNVENARLMLGNFLRTLTKHSKAASLPDPSVRTLQAALEQARQAAFHQYQRELA
ncbi:hypothetical protein Poli38472_001757 [Pythium oligandrum]|uniref:Uncharacterized protein n=1 Tax=Pythium oligandrum TaxID=41045 RepID=A0A8K1FNN9_PYTOL|nr:hypothetical protein Poli38472_001757 [Pythium oligandrum]|eukprot:TMW69601.1 hypothetical protein Poli38472_001757 [Pythium oligandrum]